MNKNQTLILIEGEKEEGYLLNLLMKCFPEMSLNEHNVQIYRTNIYDLYKAIVEEYGDQCFADDDEIDIPLLISRRNGINPMLDKRKFTNILMLFDFERHDINYSDEKIRRLQKHFNSPTDDGILYLSYPMIESYKHMSMIPDEDFLYRNISVNCKPGKIYKALVNDQSFIHKDNLFWIKLENVLETKLADCETTELSSILDTLLNLNLSQISLDFLEEYLKKYCDDQRVIDTLKNNLKVRLTEDNNITEKQSFINSMRNKLLYISKMNLKKAWYIQNGLSTEVKEADRDMYGNLNFEKVLDTQISSSANPNTGIIWVLCSFVTILGEYKFYWES